MSDISTFSRWKDWLLVALCGLVFTLLGAVAAENRQRIDRLEAEQIIAREVRQQGFERLRAVEQSISSGPISRDEARDIEQRLQRQIDSLERRCAATNRR